MQNLILSQKEFTPLKNPNYEKSIDYWQNTILTVTQMNDVIPDTYGHKIPFQKYEPMEELLL